MALLVHRSNRLELLSASLADVVRSPLSDPFARECIVVQGPGMERWLAASLARELGVWGNPWFPFPRALIELFLESADEPSEQATAARFDAQSLVWQIAGQLPGLLGDPAFGEVASYLEGDRDRERLLDLSRRLAECFDQYVIYRPELVLAWEAGADAHFQAKLFRALLAQKPAAHLAQRMRRFERALASGRLHLAGHTAAEQRLPERISLFGISTLPPAFLGMLTQLSQQLDVHVFLLTPSREYWGDLDRSVATRSDLHGFLAQLGKISREFIDLLEKQPYLEPDAELFETPAPRSMLRALQADLVELTARARRGEGVERPLAVLEHDDSIQIHVCHSMVRELEVLRDQLRGRFERDSTLEPRDVIVFTPDIERYAPAIEAVFAEGTERDSYSIPFRIADRRAVRASEIAEAFFALLELLQSRLSLSDVLDFLHRECVRMRFGIAEAELDRIQHWLVSAGARWASDAEHRESFGQPRFVENSLRFALDRLLVGYAACDGEQRELFDVLPLSDAEGQSALLLGKLARFLETLFSWVQRLGQPQAPSAYTASLGALLGAMLSDEDELAIEHHALRTALADLGSEAEQAGFSEPVGLVSVQKLLELRIDRGRANLGFLAGGVTFCEPVPMRAIPFRVVCLLGMDDESFPRSSARPSFDLMAAQPRLGDRSLRDDDRQLFLEALLSARDALHISYVGKSAQDGGERPASVLVDQLLRLCDQHFVFAAPDATLSLGLEGSVSKAITHEHALHRFDARYFQRTKSLAMVSYDASAEAAARSLLSPKQPAQSFARAPLPRREEPGELSLDALARFFRRPQETFLKERLKIFLPRELDDVSDREPIAFDHLERFRLADDLLRQQGTHAPEERARLLRKAGRLAPGSVGVAQLERLETMVQGVMEAAPPGIVLADRKLSLQLDEVRLSGVLQGLEQQARVERSVGVLHVKRRLSAWISHLALCASGSEPRLTRLVGREEKKNVMFVPISEEAARAHLSDLVRLYQVGLCMPLPLFHDAAECYVTARAKDESETSALARARAELSKQGVPGMGVLEDPHVLQIWEREQLLRLEELRASDGVQTVSFAEVAERTLGPMLRATQVDARPRAPEPKKEG
ncbi:MAG: helicase/exodeoxyribonuclease gamma subunit [Myxococcaceae bacterium]|nr:helicase/exodeoxyribonuclease gamma subunit [Myxococcaceae bacterium]